MLKVLVTTIMLLCLSVNLVVSAEQQTVKVVYMKNAAPVAWEENGRALGIEPEIAEYCLSKLGLKAVHKFYPWSRAQEMIRLGEADLIITTPTQERFGYAVFGKERVVPQEWSLFTHVNNRQLAEKARSFKKLEDLKPYTIIDYIGNGWTAANLKDGYNLKQVTTIDQLLVMLSLKRGDFLFENSGLIYWLAEKTNTAKDIIEIKTNLPNTKFHYVFIVSRKSPWLAKGLVKGLDEALRVMKRSGEFDKVLKKYKFAVDVKTQLKTDQYYLEYGSYPAFKPAR